MPAEVDRHRFVVRSGGISVEIVRGARLRAWTALLVCLGLSGAFTVVYPSAAPLALMACVTAAIALAASRFGGAARRRRRDAAGAVRIDEATIHVEAGPQRLRYDREDVLDGWLESVDDAHRVVLRMRSGDVIDARVEDADAGNALLRTAGVAPEQQTFRQRLVSQSAAQSPRSWFQEALRLVILSGALAVCASTVVGVARSLLAGLAAPVGVGLGYLFLTLALGFAVHRSLRSVVPSEVVVGADGLLLRQLGRKRFIPYAQVESIEARQNGVVLRAGPPASAVLLATSPGRVLGEVLEPERARREILHRRIQDALDASRREPAPAGAELLDRGERPFAEWRHAIDRLVREGSGYRRAGVDPALLERVLESAGAPAERRIGAALALAGTGDAEQKTRVRVAAEACANDKLRIALEQAADGELEEAHLEEAIRAERGA